MLPHPYTATRIYRTPPPTPPTDTSLVQPMVRAKQCFKDGIRRILKPINDTKVQRKAVIVDLNRLFRQQAAEKVAIAKRKRDKHLRRLNKAASRIQAQARVYIARQVVSRAARRVREERAAAQLEREKEAALSIQRMQLGRTMRRFVANIHQRMDPVYKVRRERRRRRDCHAVWLCGCVAVWLCGCVLLLKQTLSSRSCIHPPLSN